MAVVLYAPALALEAGNKKAFIADYMTREMKGPVNVDRI